MLSRQPPEVRMLEGVGDKLRRQSLEDAGPACERAHTRGDDDAACLHYLAVARRHGKVVRLTLDRLDAPFVEIGHCCLRVPLAVADVVLERDRRLEPRAALLAVAGERQFMTRVGDLRRDP